MAEPISVAMRVDFKPWGAPNFVIPEERSAMPLRDAPIEVIDALAEQWIADLYAKAERPAPKLARGRP